MTSQQEKLKSLRLAFATADKDGDTLLNKQEFTEFVKIGYRKPCPPNMYEDLCKHFKKDPSIGIDWNTARAVWQQAQKPSKSPGPPKKQQNGKSNLSASSPNIKQAFAQCDKDGDGLLNQSEFHEFVKIGFQKPSCPPGMYERVCILFKRDTSKGIDWPSAFSLWKQSNPSGNSTKKPSASPSPSPRPKKNKTPPPQQSKGLNKPPNLKRHATVAIHTNISKYGNSKLSSAPAPLSPTKSTGRLFKARGHKSTNSFSNSSGSALTKENLQRLDKKYDGSNAHLDADLISNDSDTLSFRSGRRRHRRVLSGDINSNHNNARSGSVDDQDASQMVVQMMETKVKNLSTQLKLERAKRKKTEELAQSLLQQNELYKSQINDIQQSTSKIKFDNKSYRDQLRKLRTQLDDDRQTIKHLQSQRNAMKIEKDETFTLLTKIEKQHANLMKKEKIKHKSELDKLSKGFLVSLGAESSGKDVRTVIKELKDTNKALQDQVNQLAELLTRKQQSLLEALQAVDNISSNNANYDEKLQYQAIMKPKTPTTPNNNNNNNKFTKHTRRISQSLSKFKKNKLLQQANKDNLTPSGSTNDMIDIKPLSSLPKPPKRRNSQVGLYDDNDDNNNNNNNKKRKPHHRITATLFKRAVGNTSSSSSSKNKIDVNTNNVKAKEMQFAAQQLTTDVKNKTEDIQNLQLANNALVEQMQKMQQKMNKLEKNKKNKKHVKDTSITDLP